jgi:TonB family protein
MSITGNLQTLELAELLQWLAQGTKTGVLVIENGKLEKRVYFDAGKIIFSESNNPREHLGSFLIREGLIDESTLARAIKLQESTQILLGKVLVTLGSITEDELHEILQRKTEESIYGLFAWDKGGFRFVPDEAPAQSGIPLRLDVTNLVLEALRRLDESRHTGQPLVEDHSGRYSLEIEEVLNTELRKSSNGDDLDEEQDGLTDLPVITDVLIDDSDDSSADKKTYYQSNASQESGKTPLLAAAAGLLVVIGIGAAGYFLLMRPDSADGATEQVGVGAYLPAEGLQEQGVDQTGVDSFAPKSDVESPAQEPDSTPIPEPVAVESNQKDEALRSQYEAELASLRSELEEAKRDADTKAAVLTPSPEPPADLEIEANGIAVVENDPPQDELEIAEVAAEDAAPEDAKDVAPEEFESAGGDEPPSLSGSLQTISSFDTTLSSELAEELVEPQPELLPEPEPELVEEPTPPEATTPSVEEGELVKPGPTVNPPVMLTRPKPTYPQSALRLKKEAVVTLRLLINEHGRVTETERMGSKAGMGFDQAAVKAAHATTWQPATKEGVRVSMWAELKIQFRP